MTHFPNRILFLGFGAVAECTLPIFFRHIDCSPKNLTILDFEDRAPRLREWTAKGATVVREPRDAGQPRRALLGTYVSRGDLIVDLAWNIDAGDILQWCHDHGVLYINTSTEVWDPYAVRRHSPTERTLYWRHMRLRERIGAVEGARADRRAGARGQPRADLPFHQAGTDRHRQRRPVGRQGERRAAEIIRQHLRSGASTSLRRPSA